MRLRPAAAALVAFLLPPLSAARAQQRLAITVTPEVTRLQGARIYDGLLFLVPDGSTSYNVYFRDGTVDVDASTLVGARLRLEHRGGGQPARWAAYLAYAQVATAYRSHAVIDAGIVPAQERWTRADASIALLSLGVLRTASGPWPGLRVEAGVGATLLRLRAEPAFVPASFGAGGRMDIGPLDRDFASPGGELSLAVEQRVRGRVGMRVQGALMAVRNDTEGMDGGTTFPGQPYGKSAQWTRAVPVTLGVTVHL